MKKIEFFKVEGDKINRVRKHCPKCGPGVFIAEHKDRFSCGKCGYTEFKGGGRKEQKPITSEKPIEQSPVEEKEKPVDTSPQPIKEPIVENQPSEVEDKSFEETSSNDKTQKESPFEDQPQSDEKKEEIQNNSDEIKKEKESEQSSSDNEKED
jgi:small subunit ribosomal protein S27Ae